MSILRRFSAPPSQAAPRHVAAGNGAGVQWPFGPDTYAARHANGSDVRHGAYAAAAPLALLTAVSTGNSGWTAHRVAPGETLSELAKQHRTSVATLARVNHLRDASYIRIGQVIAVPGSRRTAAVDRTPGYGVVRHVVRPGDTVSELARRYRTTAASIVRGSGLSSAHLIRIGDRISIPVPDRYLRSTGSTSGRSAAGTTARYTVRYGDTLSGIAARYRTSVRTLAALNRLGAPYVIRAGEVITVRVSSSRATSGRKSTSRNTFAGRTYSDRVVAAGDAARARLANTRQPNKAQTRAKITRTAQRFGVPAGLALAISKQESGWNQKRVSVAGAIGAMQVMPGTGEWMSDVVGRRLDLFDVDDNITAGVALLDWLLARTSDDKDAIAAYYQGLGNVQRYGHFRDTRQYVANVVEMWRAYS